MAKILGRKFSSDTHKPDITDWNLPLACISLKRNEDGCGTDLLFSDSKTNATSSLFSWPSRSWGIAHFPPPSPLCVLQSSSSGGHVGNRHKRCNKTHFTACGWVKPYLVVISRLSSGPLLGGAEQWMWRNRSKDQQFIALSLRTRLQHGPLGRFWERTDWT